MRRYVSEIMMRDNWKKAIFILLAIVISYGATLLWWRAWMYEGFYGPIPFIHLLVPSDGEASYYLTELEMFVHLLCVFLSSYPVYSKFISKRAG
jgi:hypothetical protein